MFETDLIAKYIVLSCLGIEVLVFVFVLITMKMCSIKLFIPLVRQFFFSRTSLDIDLHLRNFSICMVMKAL